MCPCVAEGLGSAEASPLPQPQTSPFPLGAVSPRVCGPEAGEQQWLLWVPAGFLQREVGERLLQLNDSQKCCQHARSWAVGMEGPWKHARPMAGCLAPPGWIVWSVGRETAPSGSVPPLPGTHSHAMTCETRPTSPAMLILWVQLFSQFSAHCTAYLSKPYFLSLPMRMLWETGQRPY